VLEVACGTGVWTEVLVQVAEHITATDCSSRVLAQARKKNLDPKKVFFIEADAYDLSPVHGSFDSGFAGFWLSHIPKNRIHQFLSGFHSRLGKGALVFMCDNTFEEGRGGRLIREPGTQDTFKLRVLPDGSEHKVLKNYYDESSLHEIFSPLCRNLTIFEGKWFWWVSYNVS
jgi:ubiquinone/menaquinone biosynthesis C-methylase UbiE